MDKQIRRIADELTIIRKEIQRDKRTVDNIEGTNKFSEELEHEIARLVREEAVRNKMNE